MTIWDEGVKRKGFGAILYYGGEYWGLMDPQRTELISKASVPSTGRFVKTVTENTPLGLMSNQDKGTWGAARYAGGSDKSFFAEVAAHPTTPEAYRQVFLDASRASSTIDSPGIRKAWYEVSRLPWMQRLYWDRWFRQVLHPAYKSAKDMGWSSERGIATLARARNSSPAAMNRAVEAAKAAGGSEANQVEAALNQYASETSRYAERAQEIRRDHPMTPVTRRPEATDLYLAATPRRLDGSLVSTSAPRADQQPNDGNGSGWTSLFTGGGGSADSQVELASLTTEGGKNDAALAVAIAAGVGYGLWRLLRPKRPRR